MGTLLWSELLLASRRGGDNNLFLVYRYFQNFQELRRHFEVGRGYPSDEISPGLGESCC
jgi:hypothetical protein